MCDLESNINQKIKIQETLRVSLKIIREYKWLIDSYVLDYFADNHWEKLPTSWKNIETLEIEKLHELLDNKVQVSIVWPLSILALKIVFEKLTICRKQIETIPKAKNNILYKSNIKNQFEKGIKLKKRHEVNCMSQITQYVATKTRAKYLIDFGAGLGHLSRILAYGYDLKVCCLEMQENLNNHAKLLDEKLEKLLYKENLSKIYDKPKHITMKLTNSITPETFKKEIRNAFNLNDNEEFTFGIVGLHPCGDLAAILIKMFLKCNEAKYLNLVGCCYMKLTQNNSENSGYPLSNFLKYENNSISNLSYESREIACHAIEMYNDRLKSCNYSELRVHAYRASIEQLIIKKYPNKKHHGLRNVKHTNNLDFIEYCKIATKGTGIDILENININRINKNLDEWKNIVIFYTLRLLFAPLIESIILYDRILYLIENGCDVNIRALCNPKLSPRNHITTAIKRL